MSSVLSVEKIQGYSQSNTITITPGHTLISDKIKVDTIEIQDILSYNSPESFLSFDQASNTFTLQNDFKFTSDSEGIISTPGATIQKKMRMIKTDFNYSTTAGHYQNFAQLSCFRTKITSKKDNSSFYVKMGINGEPSEHNMVVYPVRGISNTDNMNIADWNHNIARHLNDGENPSSQYEYYCFGYTNIGNYPDTDFSSTPIQTATMEFIDTPNFSAGTDIYYTICFLSSAASTFYVNRSVNASVAGNYERGVSYVYIEELSGPVTTTNIQSGIVEYSF